MSPPGRRPRLLRAWDAAVAFVAAPALLLALQPISGPAAVAAPRAEDVLYQTKELKIYRGVSRRGTPVVVLTNLDEEGNALSGRAGGDAGAEAGPNVVAPAAARAATGGPGGRSSEGSPRPESEAGGKVKVVVNQRGGEAPIDERDVEVTSDGSGGTTVIININPPPEPKAPPASAFYYPVAAVGGLVGGFRYPDHLHFLGYGHDNSAPSLFSGLGLNPSNRFGLQTGVRCDQGFDCMFGPSHSHP